MLQIFSLLTALALVHFDSIATAVSNGIYRQMDDSDGWMKIE